jgi:hypothetical protein
MELVLTAEDSEVQLPEIQALTAIVADTLPTIAVADTLPVISTRTVISTPEVTETAV